MAGTLTRSIINTLPSYKFIGTNLRSFHTASLVYAARKGTRAKARAKKVKVEVTKVGFIPHNQRGKKKAEAIINPHIITDTFKKPSSDDVYPMRYYRWVVYTPEEAVKAHQETHHPTMFNLPDAYIYCQVECNMKAAKKNRYLDNIQRISLLPHIFPQEKERTILAFAKTPEIVKEVATAGATVVGGVDLVKKIQEGELKINEFDFVIAHPNILTDLVPIRGLMKRKFPNLRNGTLHPDLPNLVKKFAAGVECKLIKHETHQDYASVDVPVGQINMEAKKVAENIEALIKDIQSLRPKREGLFITRCFVKCPPVTKRFKIDPFQFVEKEIPKEVADDEIDEDEEQEKLIVAVEATA